MKYGIVPVLASQDTVGYEADLIDVNIRQCDIMK